MLKLCLCLSAPGNLPVTVSGTPLHLRLSDTVCGIYAPQADLSQARKQFQGAELESDLSEKLDLLEEALALVEEVLEEPGVAESEKQVARNVRRTYIRRLLQGRVATGLLVNANPVATPS